jgi:adenosine/AMP kinase
MKIISVPARSKILNDLLRKALLEEVIMESTSGQRFVLASIQGWESFEIDEDDDITKNKKLMKHLASRRSGSKAISLSEVKNRLGLS